MPLAELQAAGSNVYVAWFLDRGYTDEQIAARLAERNPLQGRQSIDAAVRAGRRAWEAGNAADVTLSGQTILYNNAPPRTPGATGVRYWVEVNLCYANGNCNQVLTVGVDSPDRLTPEQVRERVSDMLHAQQGLLGSRYGHYIEQQQFSVGAVDFLALERVVA